jgi:hypothetical protein
MNKKDKDQKQNIHNNAPNQGAQGNFYGPVTFSQSNSQSSGQQSSSKKQRSRNQPQSRGQPLPLSMVLSLLGLLVAIAACVGAYLVVPEVRQIMGLDDTNTSFTYQVQVLAANDGEPIPGAQVLIQIGEIAPLDEFTDSNGIARIIIDDTYIGQPGRLIVRANSYQTWEQNLTLDQQQLPDTVQLAP